MKKSKLALSAIFAVVIMFGLNSCKDEPVTSDDNPYEMAVYMAPEPDNSPAVVTEATMEQPIDLVQEDMDYRMCDNTMIYGKPDYKNKRQFMPLAKILKSLNLTDNQKEQIKGFLFDFRLCIKDAVKELRLTEKEILKPFNEQRKAVVESYKNGTITLDVAKAKIKEINIAAKAALKANDARNIACEDMKLCRKNLLDKIGLIMEGDQIAKWKEWLDKLPDKPCSETVNQ
jgi:hypothetical protein